MVLIQKTQRFKTKVKRTTTEGKFSLDTRAIQAMIERDLGDRRPPRRADGTVSLDGDWLKENTPTDHEALQCLIQHDKLQKILSTYLDLYSRTEAVYPRLITLGPRSGRRSASRPNLQNVPKRKWGIRGLFPARPGHYFVRCDYTAQELFTLAQAMVDLGVGRGPMWECVTSDLDPHILGATKTLGKSYDEITKADRQGQKVVAFGVPGGLGPKSLKDYAFATFGVKWSLEEAKEARNRFLKAFWDVDKYLKSFKRPQNDVLLEVTGNSAYEWQQMLDCGWNVLGALCDHKDPDWRAIGEKCSRMVVGQLRTGRQRKHARFTEITNTHFQGLASDVAKHAEWLMFKEFGRPPAIVCHDEIVMEFPLTPQPSMSGGKLSSSHMSQHRTKRRMEELMKQAFVEVCPDVGPYSKAEGEIITRWGPCTDKDGKEIT